MFCWQPASCRPSPPHLLSVLHSAVPLGCSPRAGVQRWPTVLTRGLLPATPPYEEAVFQVWLSLTKTVNIFSLPVLLGLLTLLNWTATSREIALGAARVLQLLQVDFSHGKVVWSFSYNTSHLVNQKATIRGCVSAWNAGCLEDSSILSVLHSTSKKGSEEFQQSRCAGTLFLLFLFHWSRPRETSFSLQLGNSHRY